MKATVLLAWTLFIVWGWQLERHDFQTREGCQEARAAILATGALKSAPNLTPCIKDVAK